jgi:hypothetical protein
VGELRVFVEEQTADVRLDRASTHVFGTMCSWYPQDPSYLGDYLVQNVSTWTYFQFVDRNQECPWSLPGDRPFGYGVYKVSVGSAHIYVDFRDADYGTLTGYDGYQDMEVTYTSGDDYFTDKWSRHFALGATYHVWDMEPKEDPVQIPITITDNLNGAFGGSVKVNGTAHQYPYKAYFDKDENITVEAAATQQPNWVFDSWSDGGARSHTVTTDLDKFAYVLTARYIQNPRFLDPNLSTAAYPNPFNPTTRISYSISGRQHVKLTITDNLGRQVQVLEDGLREPGTHEVIFDGSHLPSGFYFYRVQTGGKSITRPLLLVK